MAEIKSDTNVLTANTETNLLTCPSLQPNFSYKLFKLNCTTCTDQFIENLDSSGVHRVYEGQG